MLTYVNYSCRSMQRTPSLWNWAKMNSRHPQNLGEKMPSHHLAAVSNPGIPWFSHPKMLVILDNSVITSSLASGACEIWMSSVIILFHGSWVFTLPIPFRRAQRKQRLVHSIELLSSDPVHLPKFKGWRVFQMGKIDDSHHFMMNWFSFRLSSTLPFGNPT